MTTTKYESQLVEALKKLESAADKIAQTQGYVEETAKIRLIAELLKEQIRNENSDNSARAHR